MKAQRVFDLFLLLILWALLAWRGFPFPHPDDGVFIGAALHLAAGGGLQNPLLETSAPYYLYPPFYDFFLAGWLRAAGISAVTVILFHLAVCFAGSWLVLQIFRAWGRPGWRWPGVVLYVEYVACFGLRSDALGLVFVLLSMWLGLTSSRARAGVAPFFALLGMATHPPLLALVLPWIFWLAWTKPPARIGALLGAAAVGLLLVLFLHGDLTGFIRTFLENGSASRQGTAAWLARDWFRPQNIFKVALLPLAALLLAARKMRRDGIAASDAAFLIALLLGCYVVTGSLTGNRLLGLISVLGILGYLTAGSSAGTPARVAIAIAMGIFALSIARPLLEGVTGSKPAAAEVQALQAQWRTAPRPALVVDWWSLRYVFDFRPPPGTVYVSCDRRGPLGRALLFPGESGVISAGATGFYKLTDPGLPRPVYLRVAGHPVGQWMLNPGAMTLISQETP